MAIDFSALLPKDDTTVVPPRHRGVMPKPDPIGDWEALLRAYGIEPGPALPPRHTGVMPKSSSGQTLEGRVPTSRGRDLPPTLIGRVPDSRDQIDPSTAWDNLLQSQGIEPGPAVPPRPQLSSAMPREVTHPQPAVEMRAPAAEAGPSAAALGDMAGFDFAAARADDLRARIEALDQQFPVRSGKRYTLDDLQPAGPGFASMGRYKGTGYLELRNPVSGQQGWAPPGAGQAMVDAANRMVLAKAQARGDLIRGYSVEDAMVNALAEAAGVDPEMVRGMGMQQAQSVLGPMAQRAKRDQEAAEETARRSGVQGALGRVDPAAAGMVEGVGDTRDAMSVFDLVRRAMAAQEEEKAAQEKARLGEENRGKLAGAAQQLYQMDPDEAIRVAPSILGPLATPGGAAYNAIVGDLENRSAARRQQSIASQRDTQARGREERVAKRKQAADVTKRFDDLRSAFRKVSSAAPSIKRVKGDGIGAESKDEVSWGDTVSEQYATLINAIHEAEDLMPGSTGTTGKATLQAPFSTFWHPDAPEKSSNDLKQRADDILRAIAEARAAARGG